MGSRVGGIDGSETSLKPRVATPGELRCEFDELKEDQRARSASAGQAAAPMLKALTLEQFSWSGSSTRHSFAIAGWLGGTTIGEISQQTCSPFA
jgi:hypothetical protein